MALYIQCHEFESPPGSSRDIRLFGRGTERLEPICTSPGQQAGGLNQRPRRLLNQPFLSPSSRPRSVSGGGRKRGEGAAWSFQLLCLAPLPLGPGLAPHNTPTWIVAPLPPHEVRGLCSSPSLPSFFQEKQR